MVPECPLIVITEMCKLLDVINLVVTTHTVILQMLYDRHFLNAFDPLCLGTGLIYCITILDFDPLSYN